MKNKSVCKDTKARSGRRERGGSGWRGGGAGLPVRGRREEGGKGIDQARPGRALNFTENSKVPLISHITHRLSPSLIMEMKLTI